jgi:hypothetical protein
VETGFFTNGFHLSYSTYSVLKMFLNSQDIELMMLSLMKGSRLDKIAHRMSSQIKNYFKKSTKFSLGDEKKQI